MKALVVYYSFEGDTKLVGDLLAKELGADTLELKLVLEPKSKDYMKNYLGEKQVLMKTEPKLLPYDYKIADYDLIIIGTPIWSGTFAPALRSFFSQEIIENKNLAFFYCFTVTRGRISRHLRKALKGNNFLTEIGFKDPVKDDIEKVTRRIKKWISKLQACYDKLPCETDPID
ncbi:MAG: flavodoxin family protein [Asgard group archaeon]|nr:flavodoxin family protein [Asgard group archaeon]